MEHKFPVYKNTSIGFQNVFKNWQTGANAPAFVSDNATPRVIDNAKRGEDNVEDIETLVRFLHARVPLSAEILRESVKTNFRALKTRDVAQKYMKQKKVRGRIAGYLFRWILRNVPSEDRSNNAILSKEIERACHTLLINAKAAPYNSDKEYIANKWLIPLSGNLTIDMMSNYIAKVVSECDEEILYKFIDDCADVLGIMCVEACLSAYRTYTVCIPTYAPPPDAPDWQIEEFLQGFTDTKDYPQQALGGRLGQIPFLGFSERKDGWVAALFDQVPALSSENGSPSMAPHIGIIDTRMVPPASAFSGINLKAYFEKRRNANPLHLYNMSRDTGDFELTESESRELAFLNFLKNQINYERSTFYEYRRDALKDEKQRKKASKEDTRAVKELVQLKVEKQEWSSKMDGLESEKASLQRKVQTLEMQIKKLQDEAKAAEKNLKHAELTAQKNESHVKSLQDEIDALQALLNPEKEPEAQGSAEEVLDTSIFDGLRIVCVGGHPTWEVGMTDLHPNIKYYTANTPEPENSVLDNADCIWLQTNSINHGLFWRVCDRARISNTPLRYFRYAGHRMCRKQIVEETKEMFSGR